MTTTALAPTAQPGTGARSAASRVPVVQVIGGAGERHDEILTPAALEFLARLDDAFAGRRTAMLAERRHRAGLLATGGSLDFVPATTSVRQDPSWRVAPPAPGLERRRTEIVAPPGRRAAAAALASGADVWIADFEDGTAPTWANLVGGQLTLLDAARAGLRHGRAAPSPTVVVRPRGWHLNERHLLVDGRPIAAPLVDFGLYLFHCARLRIAGGHGPYFSLPKLENHLEARLWNDVFLHAQELLGLERGTIRATVLVETVTAAFEMDEILHELREHAAGLTAGRWDYLFSMARTLAHRSDMVLPERERLTMTAPFLRAFTELLVRTCHRRGTHALGGMSAHVPDHDPSVNAAALAKVRLDKEREAEDGFDGSWVAHPSLVPLCRTAFDGVLAGRPHQHERTRDDVEVTAAELLSVHRSSGHPSTEGVRTTVALALRYFDAWLRGQGTVVIGGLAEDAAGAEIARCQIWQWLRHGAVSRERALRLVDQESAALLAENPEASAAQARDLLLRTAFTGDLPAFFTTRAQPRDQVHRG
ncbi:MULTISPECIES: malate synthase A [unclassified Streptomyces]|uniref:malate synthase A n=1 Tax=unclassified Streptomyces TaxID=2593676 RepID=UPI000CD56B85|nr:MULTISPECIES: malate synthase A [unclassified Streptomyces]